MKRRARGTACYHMYVCFLGEEKGWGGRTTYMSEAAYRLMKVFGYHMGEGRGCVLAELSKTSFEKNCFSAWASTLNMGLINKVDMVCLSPVGYGV